MSGLDQYGEWQSRAIEAFAAAWYRASGFRKGQLINPRWEMIDPIIQKAWRRAAERYVAGEPLTEPRKLVAALATPPEPPVSPSPVTSTSDIGAIAAAFAEQYKPTLDALGRGPDDPRESQIKRIADTLHYIAPQQMWPVRGGHEVSDAEFAAALYDAGLRVPEPRE